MAGAVTALSILLLAGCSGPFSTPGPVQGGTLYIALSSDPASLNPLVANDPVSELAYAPLFPLLYTLGPNLSPAPDLASALPTVTDSGRTLTIPLRSEARWSDGMPITADDVVYTVNTERDAQLATGAVFDWSPLVSIAKVDAHTVAVSLQHADAGFTADNLVTPIVPAHVLGKVAPAAMSSAPFNDAPTVTGGPFTFASRVTGKTVALNANARYYGGRPHVDHVVDVIGTSQAALPGDLASGSISWAPVLSPDVATEAVTTSGVSVFSYVDTAVVALQFNVRPGHVFADAAVRRALASSVDHAQVVDQATAGDQAYPVWDYIDQNSWAEHSSAETTYAHDPAHARSLLRGDGWTLNGLAATRDGQTLGAQLLYPSDDQARASAARLMAEQARGAGFALVPAPLSEAAFAAALQSGQFDAALVSMPTGADPDPSVLLRTGGALNAGGYSDPALDTLLDAETDATPTQTETAEQVRAPIFQQIEQTVTGDLPLFFLWAPRVFTGFNATVGGVGGLGPQLDGRSISHLLDWYISGLAS